MRAKKRLLLKRPFSHSIFLSKQKNPFGVNELHFKILKSFKFVWLNFKLYAFEMNIGIFGPPYRNSTLCVFQTNTSVSFCTVRMGRRSSFCHVYLICTERRRMFRWTKEEKQTFLGFFFIFLHFVQMLTGQWVQAGRDKLNVTLSGKLSAGHAGLKKHETLCWGRWLVGRGGAMWTECSSSSFLPKRNKTKKTSFCQLFFFFFNSIYCEMLTIPQVLFCQLKLQTEEESRSSSTFTAVSSLLTAGFLCIVTWSQFIGRVHVCYS